MALQHYYSKNKSKRGIKAVIATSVSIPLLALWFFTGCGGGPGPKPKPENEAPTIYFEHEGTRYDNPSGNTVNILAGQPYQLNFTGEDDVEVVELHIENSSTFYLTDTNPSDTIFEGLYNGTAPLTGQEDLEAIVKDNESKETKLPFTIKAVSDVIKPGDITDLQVSTGYDIGELDVSFTEVGDNVYVEEYQVKISIYNMNDPNNPLRPGDVSLVTGIPAPVKEGDPFGFTIDNLIGDVTYTVYVRAKDPSDNYSQNWSKKSRVAQGNPNVPFEPWGEVTAPNDTIVDVRDDYGNNIDEKISVPTPYGTLDFGKVKDGYYICTAPHRLSGISVDIMCDAVSRGVEDVSLGYGSVRHDLGIITKGLAEPKKDMPPEMQYFLSLTPEEQRDLILQYLF